MQTCSVDGCEGCIRNKKLGLCNKHYLRHRRHGDAKDGGTEYGAAQSWLAENVPSGTDECVLWPFGRFSDGYGGIQIDGVKRRVSRHVCELAHGKPAVSAMDAAHTCGNGHLGCVNDRHLYWATRSQNASDRLAHGTANRGARNGQVKLTEAQARELLALKDSGLLQKEAAKKFGVSRELVGRIWRRVAWDWL